MAYNYNLATIVGRLTKDPEFRSNSDEFQSLHFTIAVNRPFKTTSGEREADFIPVVIRGRLAKIGESLLRKGTPVLVWGRINVRQYDVNNETRWMTEISAENFQVLEWKTENPIDLNVMNHDNKAIQSKKEKVKSLVKEKATQNPTN